MSFLNFGGKNQRHQANAHENNNGHREPFSPTPTEAVLTTSQTSTAGVTAAQQTTNPGVGVFVTTSTSSNEFHDSLLPSTIESTSISPTPTGITLSSGPDFEYFPSTWNVPSFGLNQNGVVLYDVSQWPLASSGSGLAYSPVMFVCQTNATSGATMNSENTWSISQITGQWESSHPSELQI